MTIPATASEVSYAGNGVTLAFPITFVFDTSADLKVIETTTSTGNAVVVTTGFSISGGGGSTGTLTYSVAPATGVNVTIIDNPEITQTADYTANDAFPADAHERALDRGVRIEKRLAQLIAKSWRFNDGDPGQAGALIPSVQARKGLYPHFNDTTGALEYVASIGSTVLSQASVSLVLYPQSAKESAAGVTPDSLIYPYGNARRSSFYRDSYRDYGDVATRVNDTTFTVPGDLRSRYFITARVRLTNTSGGEFTGRIQNSTFGAVTRVVVAPDGGLGMLGNVPTTITSLAREDLVGQGLNSSFLYESDLAASQGPLVWNRSNNAVALAEFRLFVGTAAGGVNSDGEPIFGADTGLAIRVTHSTRVNSLLNGGSGFVTGASVVYHTGEPVPLVFGVNDQERIIVSAGTSAIIFLGAEESLRMVSIRADDIGGVYMSFYEDNVSTRKGYIGFANGGVNNNLVIAQEETAPIQLTGGNKHAFSNVNKAFVFDVLDAFADDVAAAAGGVEVGELYRTASAIKQRVV